MQIVNDIIMWTFFLTFLYAIVAWGRLMWKYLGDNPHGCRNFISDKSHILLGLLYALAMSLLLIWLYGHWMGTYGATWSESYRHAVKIHIEKESLGVIFIFFIPFNLYFAKHIHRKDK